MFNRTRIRLVTLYALVFFVVLNCFGAILYYSAQQRLYAQMDRSIERELRTFSFFMSRQPNRDFSFRPPRPMSYLVWDENDNLTSQTPKEALTEQTIAALSLNLDNETPKTIRMDNGVYRVVDQPFLNGRIQVVYSLEQEVNSLNSLLFLIGAGSIGSVLVAILAGYFLASRAFIPIQRAWEQQQQFISDASHEMRTPLSILQIHLERLFRHPERTIEQESQKISVMIDETKRMSKLVEDLLTLARSDAGQLKILKEKLDVSELVRKIVQEFEDIASMKGIRMETQIEEAMTVSGDADRLHQLFVILLDNALKYTIEGKITVNCSAIGNMVQISIADTGIGIAPEELPHIFDRFYRADKVRTHSEGGTGLGLSIAKWIVEAHRGTIHAESIPDKGTTIKLQLPADSVTF